MVHRLRWEKINELSTMHIRLAARFGCKGALLREGGSVAIEQRDTSLCTIDRCSDIVKDLPQAVGH
jgi:hypothetical protein